MNINDYLRNTQVKGHYKVETIDPRTSQVVRHEEAHNYIHPLLFMAHNFMGHTPQMFPSTSTLPITDNRDLVFDGSVLGVVGVNDGPSNGNATDPGNFLNGILRGPQRTYTFQFSPAQAVGKIGSIYTAMNFAKTSTVNLNGGICSNVALDTETAKYPVLNDNRIAIDDKVFPRSTSRMYYDVSGIKPTTTYSVAGLSDTAVFAGYDVANNSLIFYDSATTTIIGTDSLDNLPALTTTYTFSASAVTTSQRTGFYIKQNDKIYVANTTAIASGVLDLTTNKYTNCVATKWVSITPHYVWFPMAVADGDESLTPSQYMHFFSDRPYFVFTGPLKANTTSYSVQCVIDSLFTTTPAVKTLISRNFTSSSSPGLSTGVWYDPLYQCYASVAKSSTYVSEVAGKAREAVVSVQNPIGKVLFDEVINKPNNLAMNITYSLNVDYANV